MDPDTIMRFDKIEEEELGNGVYDESKLKAEEIKNYLNTAETNKRRHKDHLSGKPFMDEFNNYHFPGGEFVILSKNERE